MNPWILNELKKITPEEQRYLEGQETVQRDLYMSGGQSEIASQMFLGDRRRITVRPHCRFVDFPEHSHDYVELMYVCQGTITHVIGGKELVMEQGDLLLLSQNVKHSIKRAGLNDIGINFIALPEFFDIPFQMLGERNALADFLVGILRQGKDLAGQYLLFRLNGMGSIDNLMENMIASLIQRAPNEDIINQYSMGLVFLYLLNHMDCLAENSTYSYREMILQAALGSIDAGYQTASLSRIARDLHQSLSVLSRMIKEYTGFTFQELLIRKRLEKAAVFLVESDLSVDEIGALVGYENSSFFHRKFKERYGITPSKYRKERRQERGTGHRAGK